MKWSVCEDEAGCARHGWRPEERRRLEWCGDAQGGGGVDHPNKVQQKRIQTEIEVKGKSE